MSKSAYELSICLRMHTNRPYARRFSSFKASENFVFHLSLLYIDGLITSSNLADQDRVRVGIRVTSS